MATKREKRQAAALVDLEYGPQFNQIRDMWGQTGVEYKRDRRAARNTALTTTQAARSSEPKVRAIYGDAGKDLKQSGAYVDKALKAVGPGEPTALSGLVQQAMLRERGSARNANTAARASNLTDLQNKITGAAGRQGARAQQREDQAAGRAPDPLSEAPGSDGPGRHQADRADPRHGRRASRRQREGAQRRPHGAREGPQ
jgi:hypothetical protein